MNNFLILAGDSDVFLLLLARFGDLIASHQHICFL